MTIREKSDEVLARLNQLNSRSHEEILDILTQLPSFETSYPKALKDVKSFERKLGIVTRWTTACPEFIAVQKRVKERNRDIAREKLKTILIGQTLLKDVLHRSMINSVHNATARAKTALNNYNKACKSLDLTFQDVKYDDIKSLDDSTFWDPGTATDINFRALRQYMNVQLATEVLVLLMDKEEQLKLRAKQMQTDASSSRRRETRGRLKKVLEQDVEEEDEDIEEECPEDRLMISFADIIMGIVRAESGEESIEDLLHELKIQNNVDANDVP
ncbi:hypothetical protein BDB00DRAFT_877738 [Zychaea mexicana]|uniref:uncharacterized protein n=1 Tax=Zychaea mexicana TaxID=64656 RepID=UPI0022FE82F8|nr:uncharacterized protein BDB00DRAFT_877738 [Zychaea mexicana]KAI9488187.1 hypothetical protein BDB00DRAFT_877738 [Zychaea mexicana]